MNKKIILLLFLTFATLSSKAVNEKTELKIILDSIKNIQIAKENAITIEQLSKSALLIAQKTYDTNALISLHNNLGVSHYLNEDYNEALNSFYKSVNLLEFKNNNKKRGEAYLNIANIHDLIGNTDRSIFFLDKSITYLKKEENTERGLSSAYLNKGILQLNKENYGDSKNLFFSSLKIKTKINDKSGIARCNNNLGLVFMELANYPEAINYFNKAELYFTSTKSIYFIPEILNNKAYCYFKNNKVDSAKKYILKGINSSSIIDELEIKKSLYLNASEIFEADKKHKKALVYKNLYLKYKDSIANKSNLEEYVNIETNYRQEKTNLKQTKKSNFWLYFLFTSVVLIMFSILFFFNKRKQKKVLPVVKNNNDFYNSLKETLTKREIEIFSLLVKAYSSSKIAEELFLSINTVNTHRKNIYSKLNISSSSELLIWAAKNGLSI